MKNSIRWLLVGLQALLTQAAFAQASEQATVEKAGNDNLLWLAGLTLLIGLGFGFWQLKKVNKAKRNNEHTSLTDVQTPSPAKKML